MAAIYFPDAPPAVAGSEDDEFADNSAGVPSGWTEIDHGSTATVTERDWGLEISRPTGGGDQLAGIYKAIPAGDFSITAKLGSFGPGATNYLVSAIALFEAPLTSTADIHILTVWSSSAFANRVLIERWAAYNSFSATLAALITGEAGGADPSTNFVRIRRNGTTYEFDASTDGVCFQRGYTTAALGYVPTHFGLLFNNSNSGLTAAGTSCFFRYQASDVGLNAPALGQRINIYPR